MNLAIFDGWSFAGGMVRKARVEFPGAVYHLLDRGDWREPIFRDDWDREAFLAALGEVCRRTVQRSHDEAAAEALIATGLGRLALTEEDLPRLKKSDPRKMAIAGLVRRETAVSNRWLAQRLHLGHVSQASRAGAIDLPSALQDLAPR